MLLIKIHICPPQLSHCHLLVVNVVLDQCKVGSLCSVGCSTSTVLYIKYVYINYSINPNQNNLRSITVASFMHPAPLQPPPKKTCQLQAGMLRIIQETNLISLHFLKTTPPTS